MSRTYRNVKPSRVGKTWSIRSNGVRSDVKIGKTFRDGHWVVEGLDKHCDWCMQVRKKRAIERISIEQVTDALKYDPDESYLE